MRLYRPSFAHGLRRTLLAAGAAALLIGGGCTLRARAADPETPKHTNRLAKETSPYLLQHAHNPVDWYPWGEEAFAKAKRDGKPIFLSIGYSACHWCHVMEREDFEDEGIAGLLNDGFVAVKVDREERPDLDETYMTALQLLTGSGGWPASLFLTPDGKPFYGGTYFPHDAFAELLRQVTEGWKQPAKRAEIDGVAERVAKAVGEASLAPARGSLSPTLLTNAVTALTEDYDAANGGFGGAPKFPPALRLAFMLQEQRRRPDSQLLEQATTTLDRMARGGIYDQVGGGFHRYSTDARWLVPHFEKMLYDQALLAWVYLDAARLTSRADDRRTGSQILDFVLTDMAAPKGGFASTLDADSDGGEGRFYLWRSEEVVAVLGPEDGPLFNRIYGITGAGNFEGRSIPNLLDRPVEDWARELNVTPDSLWARLDRMRGKLRTARAKRPHPSIDDKVLASWNGLMIRSLALGYRVTGHRRYRDAARHTANFILAHMQRDGRLFHVTRAGVAKTPGFLEDYAAVIDGLVELYQADHDPRWIREAQRLVDVMHPLFWDEASGSYFSAGRDHDNPLARARGVEDGPTPSGPSMAALALVQLSQTTGNHDLRARARRLLDGYTAAMRHTPAAFPTLLLAAELTLTAEGAPPAKSDPARVTVAAPPKPARPGDTVEIVLQLELADGWHVNAHEPSNPDLIPTQVTAGPSPFGPAAITYPPTQTVTLGFSTEPLKVYTGSVPLRVRLSVPANAKPGTTPVTLTVRYQPCNDRSCLAPAEKSVTVKVTVAAARRRR